MYRREKQTRNKIYEMYEYVSHFRLHVNLAFNLYSTYIMLYYFKYNSPSNYGINSLKQTVFYMLFIFLNSEPSLVLKRQ